MSSDADAADRGPEGDGTRLARTVTDRPDRAMEAPVRLAFLASGGPAGPLGQFGPLGPLGPLGPHGPVRTVRPAVTAAYERWKGVWEGENGLLTDEGPFGPRGPLGLGPFADQPIDRIEEAEYQEALTGSTYVVGSVAAGEADRVWDRGEGFEDVYEIRLQHEDTVTIVLTQARPTPGFDLVLLDEDGDAGSEGTGAGNADGDAGSEGTGAGNGAVEADVVARSSDAPGQVKFLQATLPAGSYRVGISFEDGRTIGARADREYALSVVIY